MGGVLAAPLTVAGKLLLPTPRQPAGPFYPVEIPLDDDNDLTWVRNRDQRAKGQTTDLDGRLLDVNGRALNNVRIEIWQCDAQGRYRHPRDRGGKPLDPNFQGHGSTRTDKSGRYRFRTIRPVPYPGRTPHIHVAVFPPGEKPFVTQLYIRDEPRNPEDFLFRRVPPESRDRVTAEFLATNQAGADYHASFDIVLGVTPAA
jgi:protocatechuate 3,4-dioxygenase beta subunit